MNLEIVWNNFLQKIKEDLTPLSYETWFQDTRLVSLKDNTAFVIVPMELHKKHLIENYLDIMENKIYDVLGSDHSFELLI